ncbi:MAG: BsuPI-related putative proteinase inhibitor [Firmicutes bacterium]|nr:BsuPI-related putative proteinase inhibitor [Bacillota bacterium]
MIEIKLKRNIRVDKKKTYIRFAFFLLLIIAAFVVGLNYFIIANEPLTKSARLKIRSLLFTMRMKETSYQIGQPIEIELEARNISYKPVTLKFDENLEYDFSVLKEKNFIFARIPMTIWRFSANRGAEHKPHTVTLQPQEVLTYSAAWDQKDYTGKQVSPGRYIITGTINLAGQSAELQMRGKMGGK